jgi:Icc-related predicted phosphoesterase
MKIQLLSDLHNEFETYEPVQTDADVIVLAGDIHTNNRGVEWAAKHFGKPVLYVHGNHEAYGKAIPKYFQEIKELATGTNVTVLENDVETINGVNFFGCTLWTDFEIITQPRIAGYECQQVMNDYKKIKKMPSYSKIRSIDTALYHTLSIKWLGEQLEQYKGQCNVVITHHAPSIMSIPPHKKEDILTSAYASNLEGFIAKYDITLWVHGHIHNSCDYHLGNTRIVCNPKGYLGHENNEYDRTLVISV